MAGKIHSGGTVHFRLRGDRRVVRRDGAKTLTVDRRPCAARLQRSLFPADRLARAPGRRTPLAVRPLPAGRARPGRLQGVAGALPLEFEQTLTLKLAYPDVLYANPRTWTAMADLQAGASMAALRSSAGPTRRSP